MFERILFYYGKKEKKNPLGDLSEKSNLIISVRIQFLIFVKFMRTKHVKGLFANAEMQQPFFG